MNVLAIQSPSAALRVHEARTFIDQFAPGDEVLLLGASRGAVDDFARAIALDRGATFGLHRLSFTQLAARLATLQLASTDCAPSTILGHEAVATRATFEADTDEALEYFSPVARTPGFPKALARTLLELRLAGTSGDRLNGLPRSGRDLAELLDRVDVLMTDAGATDRAALFEMATKALAHPSPFVSLPVLLLDVPFDSEAEARFLWALVQQSPAALITVPAGDARTLGNLADRGLLSQTMDDGRRPMDNGRSPIDDLDHLQRFLFSEEPPPERERTGELVWFSAPGEGRECVEIARRILKEAARGVRFDEMAILVRSPQQYLGVLEHALGRAGIAGYFDRGTRRPHPAGRAFLAVLTCATEHFSARRFAEYLSLAQVPNLDPGTWNPELGTRNPELGTRNPELGTRNPEPGTRNPEPGTWIASTDDVFGIAAEPPAIDGDTAAAEGDADAEPDTDTSGSAVVNGTLRAPWKWESLLVESAVIGGADRWKRRLDGLDREYELRISELRSEDSDSPRIARIERERQNLAHLRAFALPLIESMSAWPDSASWGDWLERLEGLAPRVLRKPADVLRVLADLRPMGAVGPVTLREVRDVLADRLMAVEVDPPAHRYGRVFIGSPHQARGRSFRVVFVPGLAERLFPQKLREDPLLLDELRHQVKAGLVVQEDRAELERLLLRLSVGAAAERLYVSFPRIETAEARQRVPSFYALEVMRAVTGRIPEHQVLETEAAREANASLAWPAPDRAADAIDDFEHDLSVLRALMRSNHDVKGHAHYMLRLNDCLRRSATERWARSRSQWSNYDGIVRVTDATRTYLQSQRLGARPYSVSALQNFSYCPYRFLLSAMYRLEPLEEPEPLQRLDPLTKGSLFHEVQAEFYRALQKAKQPIGTTPIESVLKVLDHTLTRVAAQYAEKVSPAVDHVWQDEVAGIRTDLHIWARDLAATTEWQPWRFEFAFGLPEISGRDPHSLADPVTIDGRFLLRGSVDLIERRAGGTGGGADSAIGGGGASALPTLRITDHKTSKNRSQRNSKIGGGQQLQPIIYSLAVEAATGATVETARFSYCTTAGGFTEHVVPINEHTRRLGLEVMEIIDRAVELGVLPPAPAERACRYCDFLSVCGPDQERRAGRKSKQLIADLLELRGKP